jgi:hypothetical protein
MERKRWLKPTDINLRIMKKLLNKLDQWQYTNNYAFYFSLFRVFVCVLLLRDIVVSWKYINVLYRGASFLPVESSTFINLTFLNEGLIREYIYVFFLLYIVVIMLFFFGIGKHFTALALLIFADTYQYFSIKPLNYKRETWRQMFNFCSNLAGLSICMHLCWAYFLSAFHKTHADVWFNGIATYYTLSLERFKGTPFNDTLARNGIFVTLSTYFTILTEMFFPVLVWFKQTRLLVILAATFLHMGIFVFMMIYDFQLIFIASYGFFFSDQEWSTFRVRVTDFFRMLSYRARTVFNSLYNKAG